MVFLAYGVLFQEYFFNDKLRGITSRVMILWVTSAFVLSSAFMANLKSSLINKTYEDKTNTLNEIVDKDMIVHMSRSAADYMETNGEDSRLLCQAKKYNSVSSRWVGQSEIPFNHIAGK